MAVIKLGVHRDNTVMARPLSPSTGRLARAARAATLGGAMRAAQLLLTVTLTPIAIGCAPATTNGQHDAAAMSTQTVMIVTAGRPHAYNACILPPHALLEEADHRPGDVGSPATAFFVEPDGAVLPIVENGIKNDAGICGRLARLPQPGSRLAFGTPNRFVAVDFALAWAPAP